MILLLILSTRVRADEKVSCPVACEQSYILIDGVNVQTLKSAGESVLLQFDNDFGSSSFSEGLAAVPLGGKLGYIEKPDCK